MQRLYGIPKSTFQAIYDDFWMKNHGELDAWVTKLSECMFSSVDIRLLSSKLKNPSHNECVTLIMDSHDSRIDWGNPQDVLKYRNGQLSSWKLDFKSGGRTQTVIDCNGFAILHSKTVSCRDNVDGGSLLIIYSLLTF